MLDGSLELLVFFAFVLAIADFLFVTFEFLDLPGPQLGLGDIFIFDFQIVIDLFACKYLILILYIKVDLDVDVIPIASLA